MYDLKHLNIHDIFSAEFALLTERPSYDKKTHNSADLYFLLDFES